MCLHESVSVSSGREQGHGNMEYSYCFCVYSFHYERPSVYRSPHHYNLILVGVIIVRADAGNSHIFREIHRGDITLAKKHK